LAAAGMALRLDATSLSRIAPECRLRQETNAIQKALQNLERSFPVILKFANKKPRFGPGNRFVSIFVSIVSIVHTQYPIYIFWKQTAAQTRIY
jgi:hypothetical protein